MSGEFIHHLSIDIETYSYVDIKKAGLFKYAQSPAFEILLFAYSLDGGPVQVVDLTAGEEIPQEIRRLLFNRHCLKHAYNAAFEWYCLSRYFGLGDDVKISPEDWLPEWHCTMLHAMYLGFPSGLSACGEAIGLAEDKKKLSTGKALIRYFCVPCAPTKANGGRTRNLPRHDPAKWELFKEYNAQDVVTEMAIADRIGKYPVPQEVWGQWVTDQSINLRGVAVDTELVKASQELDTQSREACITEATEITGISNPNSVSQMLEWVQEQGLTGIADLTKGTVSQLLKGEIEDSSVRRVLEIRQELGKTSNKKYDALAAAVCDDGRVRGLLQFYGANRTGRWAGRIVQPQNLPRTYIHGDLLPTARQFVKDRNAGALTFTFGSVPDTLSQLIRTAFVAPEGKILLDADFSAIEARVIAWLADEEWVLDVFRTHGKIYEATASQMFNIPLEKIKKGCPEYAYRQKGKVATLALGYQGGVGAMRTMDSGHELDSLSDEEVLELVHLWRKANPHIVNLWSMVEAAAMAAVQNGSRCELQGGRLEIGRTTNGTLDFMYIRLPNGRKLYYPFPAMSRNRFGRPSISYMGQDQMTKKWTRLETYGGKLVENIIQAIARDCLAEAIERLEHHNFHIVFHIHDEIVVEATPEQQTLEHMEELMAAVPTWAEGLPLNADGWANGFFKKD